RNAKYFVNGELIWEENDEKQPVIVENGNLWNNGSIVANMVDRRGTELICFDPYNRTKLWKYPVQEKPQRKIQSILRYENTLILGLSDFRGVSNWMMVALDRRTGEQIWEMDSKLAVYKHNTIVYKDSLLNLASDRLIEIDIATGTVKRDIHLDFLKNVELEGRKRRIRYLKGWKVLDDKIFFISERELIVGIVDLHTLGLLDYAFVPSYEQNPISSLVDLEVHNNQVFIVGLNPEVKSVTFIYTY
ncbi:MAG TPA: hypothetical protein PKC76_16600, partial [Saprospiraceae bacterium]|nr:hypothetical protein [Saprospiraceae bacterium]